ncbi:MAG: hypothetical protein R6U92_00080 [Bacillota bacterium]
MKLGKRFLISLLLVAIVVVAIVLTISTYGRALVSTRAARALEVEFVRLVLGENLEDYRVELDIINDDELSGEVEFFRLSLAYGGELVASDDWHPGGFRLPPESTTRLSRDLTSPLSASSLPAREENIDPDEWSVRLHIRISHPMSRDPIMLNRVRRLAGTMEVGE